MKIRSSSALLIGLAVAPWMMGVSALSDATAAPLSASMTAAPDRTAAIEQVHKRRDVRRWDRRRHGPRYRSWTPIYRYHYDGWWYATPWWFGPSITFGFGTPGYYGGYYGGYRSAHIDWCLNRYRSYDPRSDTFLGYDGLRHRCRSPYRR